ncbi:MAG: SIR2 family protein [Carboxydocellales bacterium]
MQRVFLLGSGFSVPAGAPLSKEILRKIFSKHSLDVEVAQLETWLDSHLFHNHPTNCREADFEEVISRLELFEHYSKPNSPQRRELEAMVGLLLHEFISLLQPKLLQNNLSCYNSFVSKLVPEDIILTFNYDLVVEKALERQHFGFDYLLSPTSSDAFQNNSQTSLISAIPVIKLHGSINLFFCNRCNHIQQACPENDRNLVCSNCALITLPDERAILHPFLIAPTLFKSYSLPDLRRLWHSAFKYLSNANILIVIGYSLPAADILAAQLLDFAHRSCPHPQKVLVVNGPKANPIRLEAIYGQSLENTRLAFADWVKSDS